MVRGVGVAAGAVTFGVYLVGSGRSYDYDSSETVGSFIATRSLLDPFRRQLQFNNHPLFSFLEHLVYSAGGKNEAALRVVPAADGAATVGLLAANPTYAELSRSVRGY